MVPSQLDLLIQEKSSLYRDLPSKSGPKYEEILDEIQDESRSEDVIEHHASVSMTIEKSSPEKRSIIVSMGLPPKPSPKQDILNRLP